MTAPHIAPVGVTGWIVCALASLRQRWRPVPDQTKKSRLPRGWPAFQVVLLPQEAGATVTPGDGAAWGFFVLKRKVASTSYWCLPIRLGTTLSTSRTAFSSWRWVQAAGQDRWSINASWTMRFLCDSDSTAQGCVTVSRPSRTILPSGYRGFLRKAHPSGMSISRPVWGLVQSSSSKAWVWFHPDIRRWRLNSSCCLRFITPSSVVEGDAGADREVAFAQHSHLNMTRCAAAAVMFMAAA